MNVGLVVPGFSADPTDWCIPALRHLARALAASDHVRVIAVRYPYCTGRYPIDGADVVAIGGAVRRGPATLGVWRGTLNLLRAEHQRQPFDVLHAFWATESGFLAAIAGRLLRVPTLVSLAGGELVGFRDIGYGDQRIAWERLKVRASTRLASMVSAGSRLLLQLAESHVPVARLRRAPLGVDLERFQPAPHTTNHPPRFVHVGTLTPVKDHATLLRAFALLRRDGQSAATLEVVGDGPLRSDLERLARALEVDESVCFRGEIDHAALPDVYRAADALVLSSRHEAQGMVALEAAACGTAVVGTRVGVIPELTDEVASIGAPEALAHAMAMSLSASSPAADQLERVRADFGLGTCVDRFRRLYTEISG